MKALFPAVVVALSALAIPASAADEAACKTMWETADANKDGSLDATEGTKHMDAIKTAGGTFETPTPTAS